jgi:hypothetical protein
MSSSDQPSERCRCMWTAGSRSPERVPITRPSSGVRPIDVSTDSPPRTAVADAPLPRCSTITLVSETSRPRLPPPARETKACEVPWNPYRRMWCSSRHARGTA